MPPRLPPDQRVRAGRRRHRRPDGRPLNPNKHACLSITRYWLLRPKGDFKTGALNHSATLPATRDQAVSRSKVKNDAGTEVMLTAIGSTPRDLRNRRIDSDLPP